MSSILKDLANNFVLPLWNKKDLTVVDSYVSPLADIQTTFLKGSGPQALKENVEQVFNGLSTFEYTIQESTPLPGQVIFQWRGEAIHTGPLFNIEPSGKRVYFSGTTSIAIRDSTISRYYCFSDLPRVIATNKNTFHQGNLFNFFSQDIDKIATTLKEITGKRLTKREVECLSLWMRGYSIKDTAKILGGLSSRTVQTFRENIKRKLGVETYQQLFNLVHNMGFMPILLLTNM